MDDYPLRCSSCGLYEEAPFTQLPPSEPFNLVDSPKGTEMDPKDLVVLGELFSVQEIIQLRMAGLV